MVCEDVPMPVPKAGEVLIKVEAAPINPSDLGFIRDKMGNGDNYPYKCGFEGSGLVVASGGGLAAWSAKGKRVSFFAQGKGKTEGGSWAEYVTVNALQCITLPNSVSFEHGACANVNPLSAVGLLERC